jgi:uncharacterized membrane protein
MRRLRRRNRSAWMWAVGLAVLVPTACGDGGPLPTGSQDESATGPQTEVEYSHDAIALSSMGGARSNAWAINDHGVAVGWTELSGGRAIRWSEEHGAEDLLGVPSSTRSINNSGTITGHLNNGGQRAFVLSNGVRHDLEPLQVDAFIWLASSINDDGTIVGRSGPGGQAVFWSRAGDGTYGAPTWLGLGHHDRTPIINDHGDVTSTAWTASGHRPVLWLKEPGGGYGEPIWLGDPGPGPYLVRGINDAGVVVGFRWNGVTEVAVVWLPDDYDDPIDLGIGEAWDINNRGQIVGIMGGDFPVFGGAPRRPALWMLHPEGYLTGPEDLGTPPGYQSAGARAINEHGWIVGSSWGPGNVRATLWKPRE